MKENRLTEDGIDYEFVPVAKLTWKICARDCDLFKTCKDGENVYKCTAGMRKDKRDGYWKECETQINYF